MEINWSDFKSFITSRGLSIQHVEIDNTYFMWGLDGLFFLQCRLAKDGGADVTEFESTYKASGNKNLSIVNNPFNAKRTLEGKKLYRKKWGYSFTLLASGDTVFSITVPYAKCKIIDAEFLWFPAGVTYDFKIKDTSTGTYSGVPNYVLGHHSINVGIAEGRDHDISPYDADVYAGMILEVTIHNTTLTSKTVCINIPFHEVV